MNHPITRLARAEKMAEGDRKAAETHWRKTWWATTMALAAPADSAKKEIGEMLTEAEAILGQSRQYLKIRRLIGKAFSIREDTEIETLPPRKARVVIDAKVAITDEVIEMIRESEKEEESLREFSARLTGKAWSVGSDEEIEKALESKPALAAKVAAKAIKTDEGRKAVAKALADPETAKAVIKEAAPTTRTSMVEAAVVAEVEEAGFAPGSSSPAVPDPVPSWKRKIDAALVNFDDARIILNEIAKDRGDTDPEVVKGRNYYQSAIDRLFMKAGATTESVA